MPRPPRRFRLCRLSAVVLAVGMLTASIVSARAQTSAVSAARPSASAAAARWAKTAIEKLAIGHDRLRRVPGAARPADRTARLADVVATNWAGYADTGSSVSKVSASWAEPSATCGSDAEQLAAFWVGIDGYSGNSVEQDGTLLECYQGKLYQYTWWEMYPADNLQMVGQSLTAGDAITSTVARSGTSYTLTVADSTHPADSFTKTASCANCDASSAEWIAEAVGNGSGSYPLADFRTWKVSGANVAGAGASGPITSFAADEITMIDGAGKATAQPGPLSGSGDGFSVAWERAS
jgi:hypothetical protein